MSGFDFGYIFDYDTDAKVMELSEKINSLDFSQSLTELRDVLEVYKLHQWPRDYVESDDSFEVSNVKKVIGDLTIDKELKAFIGKSLGANSADYWMIQYLAMSDLNGGCFDKLFTEYNLWVKLSDKYFAQFVDSNRFLIKNFMIKGNKQAVEKFSEIINASLVNNYSRLSENLSSIIEYDPLYFPKVFISNNGFQKMVNKYLDICFNGKTVDIALLYKLMNFYSDDLYLDEHTRFSLTKMNNNNDIYKFEEVTTTGGIFVSLADFSNEDDIAFINDTKSNVNRFDLFINTLWLDSISDEDLLLSIIHEFIVDMNGCPYAKYTTDRTWIDNIYYQISGLYDKDQTFLGRQNEVLTILMILTINEYLRKRFGERHILMEDLIVKYINSISDNYGINEFYMKELSHALDISDKNLILSISIESLLKQFDLLYRYNYVNVKYMIHFNTSHFDIAEIPSFIPSKYLEVDDSLKSYINKHAVFHGYPCYLSGKFKSEMDKYNLNYTDKSTLFATNDIFFLNHILNNKNGFSSLAIRNNYAHDSTIGLSDDEHLMNYYYILLAFLIVIAKLDEEFKWIKENGISN